MDRKNYSNFVIHYKCI